MRWTGVDMSNPLLLEVVPEIDTNPMSFYRRRGRGGVRPPPDSRYRLALAMSVHSTYFDLATPLSLWGISPWLVYEAICLIPPLSRSWID